MPCIRYAPVTAPVVHPFLKRSQADFGFNPLLEILSAVEREVSSATQQQPKRRKTVIHPNFDIRETEHAFLLEGELPGVSDKNSIEISFIDAQTLVVKGEIQRKAPVADKLEPTEKNANDNDTAETESVRSLKPTVEETADESVSENGEAANSPSPATLNHESSSEKSKEATKPEEDKTNKVKYWLAERSIGVFEKKFEFQELIDQEGVQASLEHGVLEIRVPKKQPYVKKVQIL